MNLTQADRIVEPFWLARPSTEVAPDLLGCVLVRQMPDGQTIRGAIVETEAYAPGDPGCHAYRGSTKRNQVMFGPAGRAYVYFIYGMYNCLNIVTDLEGVPSAVLIRALQLESIPSGIDRHKETKPHRIAAGPGKLCRALQIDRQLNGVELRPGQPVWLEHRTPEFERDVANSAISFVQTTRIGLSAGAELPWRWYVANCQAVSKP
ncbi:MAG: DNA-3-methyladenine glycosylase [Oscillatoria sp. Prado101]|jgi:DNA-3-methyladenine glycosylase|nr:DNA-3-methyladenine glycosylase [Oscillatoria sp. Prado101]